MSLKQHSRSFCGYDNFWYFVNVNILKSYASMLHCNIESKDVYEKKDYFELILTLSAS